MTTPSATTAPDTGAVKTRRSLGARIATRAGGGVMRVVLVLVGLFWLMPTIGLLLSSLRSPERIASTGWWKVFTVPSELTFDNYSAVLSASGTDAPDMWQHFLNSLAITIPATVIPIAIAAFVNATATGGFQIVPLIARSNGSVAMTSTTPKARSGEPVRRLMATSRSASATDCSTAMPMPPACGRLSVHGPMRWRTDHRTQ